MPGGLPGWSREAPMGLSALYAYTGAVLLVLGALEALMGRWQWFNRVRLALLPLAALCLFIPLPEPLGRGLTAAEYILTFAPSVSVPLMAMALHLILARSGARPLFTRSGLVRLCTGLLVLSLALFATHIGGAGGPEYDAYTRGWRFSEWHALVALWAVAEALLGGPGVAWTLVAVLGAHLAGLPEGGNLLDALTGGVTLLAAPLVIMGVRAARRRERVNCITSSAYVKILHKKKYG
jgi:hypothetical protein